MRKQCKHIAVAGKLEIVDVRHDGLRLSEGKAISPIRAGYGHLIEKLRTRQSDIGLLLDEGMPPRRCGAPHDSLYRLRDRE